MADKTTGLKLVQIRLAPDRTLLSDTPIDCQWKCIEVMKDFYRDLDREAILVVNMDAKCHESSRKHTARNNPDIISNQSRKRQEGGGHP